MDWSADGIDDWLYDLIVYWNGAWEFWRVMKMDFLDLVYLFCLLIGMIPVLAMVGNLSCSAIWIGWQLCFIFMDGIYLWIRCIGIVPINRDELCYT